MDLVAQVGLVTRSVEATSRDGVDMHVVVASRPFAAPLADVWDALTSAERIPRWFMPVTGDLRVGGRFQLEGNAGGTILVCEPPTTLGITWEFGEQLSWVDVSLSAEGDSTRLTLRHTLPVDDHWATYGPGAVGVGWDLSILGMWRHLAHPDLARPEPSELGSPPWPGLMGEAAHSWGDADAASGTDPATATAAAKATAEAYGAG